MRRRLRRLIRNLRRRARRAVRRAKRQANRAARAVRRLAHPSPCKHRSPKKSMRRKNLAELARLARLAALAKRKTPVYRMPKARRIPKRRKPKRKVHKKSEDLRGLTGEYLRKFQLLYRKHLRTQGDLIPIPYKFKKDRKGQVDLRMPMVDAMQYEEKNHKLWEDKVPTNRNKHAEAIEKNVKGNYEQMRELLDVFPHPWPKEI